MVASHPSGILHQRERAVEARKAIMRPPPRMTVPDWADRYRYLSTSAGAVGGRWQTHRVEVARGPLMAITEPGVDTISVQSCTQLMKTEILMNTVGYFAHLDPAPLLLLQPKDEMADSFSKERVAPMIQSSPELRKLMRDYQGRRGDDTIKYKKFPGGFLAMAGAGSPSNLAMRAIRVTLLDEIDKYETTKEGDPVLLAEERTSTFFTSRLRIRACSPTWVETSRIHRSYLAGDQRKPFVRCPHCNHWQYLDFFRHVQYDKDAEGEGIADSACIFCESCGGAWSEADRIRVMTTKHGIRWMQTKPFTCCGEKQNPMEERRWDWNETLQVGYACCKTCGQHAVPHHHASFTASKLYSPFTTVVELVQKWLDAKGDPESKQTFYNTQLGQPFKAEVSRTVDAHWLESRREQFPAEVPLGGVVLTCGVDVQGGGEVNAGRLEYEVVAWGPGEESWSVATGVIDGDPALPSTWTRLDKEVLLRPYMYERGFPLYILATCIDSGGHNTQDVYNFCRARVGRNVWAIKGASDRGVEWSPVWPNVPSHSKPERYRTGYKPVILGVAAAKEAVRHRLLVGEPGPGYCHFPIDRHRNWFMQLTSEDLQLERKEGVVHRKWVKKSKGLANEALDCRVYAYAALQGLYAVRRLNLEERALTIAAYIPPPTPVLARGKLVQPDYEPARKRPERKVHPSSWMEGT